MCVTASFFPSEMKLAEITPFSKEMIIFAKRITGLYTTSRLHPSSSKISCRISWLSTLVTYCVQHCLPIERDIVCQHVILRLTEYWRRALDNGNAVGTIAMDLSRTFDKMPHTLLIAKLNAYGLSEHACNLIISYLRNRKHRVKIMGKHSDWVTTNRGVPQGSVLGPLLFNIFYQWFVLYEFDMWNNKLCWW